MLADNSSASVRPAVTLVMTKGRVIFQSPGRPPIRRNRRRPGAASSVYIPPAERLSVADGFRPNGIQLSRDEKTLYINNTGGEYLLAFDVQGDGTLKNRRDFAKYENVTRTESGVTSGADGLAIDNEGRIYIATPSGIQVFSEQGKQLGTIPLPGPPQNLAFAGPDKKTLYIVGRGNGYRIQCAPGSRV